MKAAILSAAGLAVALVLSTPDALQAQTLGAGSDGAARSGVISPVLIIDSDRLWRQSERGQQVAKDFEGRVSALNGENEQIEKALEAEEQALTAKRAEMAPTEFRALADTFDAKVQRTRAEQAEKARALTTGFEAEREQFVREALPTLERLMREAGAAVILERRSVFVSASAIDITDRAIDLLDDVQDVAPLPD